MFELIVRALLLQCAPLLFFHLEWARWTEYQCGHGTPLLFTHHPNGFLVLPLMTRHHLIIRGIMLLLLLLVQVIHVDGGVMDMHLEFGRGEEIHVAKVAGTKAKTEEEVNQPIHIMVRASYIDMNHMWLTSGRKQQQQCQYHSPC